MNFQAFVDTLPIMGIGMLGIFMVMGVIFAMILLLGSVRSKKGQNKQ